MNDKNGKAMKISDEIREWCNLPQAFSIPCDELYELADRIDAEMVELPKDMDGVPIHIGDTAYLYNGFKAEVKSIEFNQGEQTVIFTVGFNGFYPPSAFTHTRPDSWERIADELDKWCDGADVNGDACGKPRDLADRIRKLAKKEG